MLLGVKSEPIVVSIPFSWLGDDVKNALKEGKPDVILAGADEQRIHPAIKNGRWLGANDELVKLLENGERTPEVEEMLKEDLELDDVAPIGEWLTSLGMIGELAPTWDQIHAVVDFPKRSFDDILLQRYVGDVLRELWHCRTSSPPEEDRQFKTSLVRTYKCGEEDGMLRCSTNSLLQPESNFDIQTTFGDIDGRSLHFEVLERPYNRCLNLHAHLARMRAIDKKWIQREEDTFEEFWTDGMSLNEKMRIFHASLAKRTDAKFQASAQLN